MSKAQMGKLPLPDGWNVYYNEIDPFCVEWLSELMFEGLIPSGEIDTRPIQKVRPKDLKGFDECHFFAGIGGWAYALELAGWRRRKGETIWTGSCPCQPFSQAGKRRGVEDERHLWPDFKRLIANRECRPAIVFGEQVASKDGRVWLSGVRSDLEAVGYAVGAADLCAAGKQAPHIRQRLWWVGHSYEEQWGAGRVAEAGIRYVPSKRGTDRKDIGPSSEIGRVANNISPRLEERQIQPPRQERKTAKRSGDVSTQSGLENSAAARLEGSTRARLQRGSNGSANASGLVFASPSWNEESGAEAANSWIYCLDGKYRRVPSAQSGIQPLAHGVSNRVGMLRGSGNAIVPQVAAEFIKAFKECINT